MGSPETALNALGQLVDQAPGPDAGIALGNWRWTTRQQLNQVRDQLIGEPRHSSESWLEAKRSVLYRERTTLLARLKLMTTRVLNEPDVSHLQTDLRALLHDLAKHFQHLRDLAWDEVELEIGGSE